MKSKVLRCGYFASVRGPQVRHFSAPSDGTVPPAKQKYVPSSGFYPKGFLAGTTHVGVKASNTRFDDLTVIASEIPCVAAATFTRNRYRAAPVVASNDILQNRNFQGLRGAVINSGCANAVTGEGGRKDALDMVDAVDTALASSFPKLSVEALGSGNTGQITDGGRSLVMSTGVIGQRLPMSKILPKIPEAVASLGSTHDHWLKAARAICTTDTFPKLTSRQFELPSYPGAVFSMVGMTKGAGMIHPNMGTLLGVICTDAPIDPTSIKKLLTYAVNRSFNAITIDGDTSTNDTVALFANGAAANLDNKKVIKFNSEISSMDPDGVILTQNLLEVTKQLSQLVVRDGEGATKFVRIRVLNAPGRKFGRKVASRIACSPLVKTALYGKDANWGRILCAIGNADGPKNIIDPSATSVSFVSEEGERLELLTNGEPQNVDESLAAKFLENEDLNIHVDLAHKGDLKTDIDYWTCDFSHEYVTINGDYRT